MPMEYFIEELKGKSRVQHGSTFSFNQAQQKAASINARTGNPVNVKPEWIAENRIEAIEAGENADLSPLTAQELFEEVRGKGARLDEQDFRTKLIYQLLTESANEALEGNGSQIIEGGAVESGSIS